MIRRKILWSSLGATAEEKGSQTGGVGGDTILCLSTSVDKPYGARNGGGERRRNGRAELHPKCSPRAALALHRCDTTCRAKGFKFFEIAAPLKQVWPNTINLCKTCYNERRLQQGEEQVAASKWRALVEQMAFRGKLWAAFGMKQVVRGMWRRFTIKQSLGKIGLGRCRKCQAQWNGRQVATRDAVQGGTRAGQAQQSASIPRREVRRLGKLSMWASV